MAVETCLEPTYAAKQVFLKVELHVGVLFDSPEELKRSALRSCEALCSFRPRTLSASFVTYIHKYLSRRKDEQRLLLGHSDHLKISSACQIF